MPNPNLDPDQGEGRRVPTRNRDRPETEDSDDRLAAEEAAMRVEEEPPT
jgi:hypothetical protein